MHQHLWRPQDASLQFAWVPPAHHLVEPVRATPLYGDVDLWDAVAHLSAPLGARDPFTTQVTLHHPDLGAVPSRIDFTDLRGSWDALPLRSLVEATGWDPKKTWDQIAQERYAWVCEQRHIADRLTALGIPRSRRHYAGQGGTSADVRRQSDTTLILSHEELLEIIQLAEVGMSLKKRG
jgi:hypothetical protein